MSTKQTLLTRQVQRLERTVAHWLGISNRFSNARLTLLGIGLPITLLLWRAGSTWAGMAGLMVTLGLFTGLVIVHRRYQAAIRRFQLWQKIKRDHLARLTLTWSELPPARFASDSLHPFELDIDLPQLARLVDTSATRGGAARLWDWLRHTHPEAETIQQRQAWIAELAKMPIFRDQLRLQAWLAHEDLRQGREGHDLADWLASDTATDLSRPLWVSIGLGVGSFILTALWLAEILPPFFLILWLPYAIIYLWHRPILTSLLGRALSLSSALRQVASVLGYVEEYRYGPHSTIRALCDPIIQTQPSQRLRRLEWIVGAAGVQANPYLWLILNAFFPWDMWSAHQLNQQQRQLAGLVPQWLTLWADLEALASLANFAALHPDYPFPTITDSAPLRATQLGHPLIPAQGKVRNDLTLDQLGQVILITGSNMAGKSSFLRTIGINLALAYAGSVVDAQHLEVSLLRLYTSMRITDSLEDGISYFYAEVKRLKALLDALQDPDDLPLCFLIDEIFRGTNNRERLLGSRAYINALKGGRGVGLVATHDLDLTTIEGIENYHFREEVRDGHMVFDYRLRQGPCPTTNALTIMGLAGLPIPPASVPRAGTP